ncbi:NifB/NifX family molybdenum-iron cluster-binding protein [Sunxiuqinia sp. A32]|uniref:NifB/NifX family molybdenum-iron cluster-binding protein n=1 Tax=Sunxiuqinia sp. A32 TaxID=3461496 RepID=UPI004046075D
MNLRLAMAASFSRKFEQKHFGEADQYLIYEWTGNKLTFKETVLNPVLDDGNLHSSEKADTLINLLKAYQVNALVSQQFGHNIKKVNALFVPVLIGTSSIVELIPLLNRQMKWIVEEWQENKGNYKLFNLKKGTIKTSLQNRNDFD